MPQTIGVCAIQGDFGKHITALHRIKGVTPIEVRTPEDLSLADKLILPGGESTTVSLLMQRFGLAQAIQSRSQAGMPIWGTCMGMILLARTIAGRPEQWSLNLLDIEVERNAFGAQVHSFEDEIVLLDKNITIPAVFIRAPVVRSLGSSVEIWATYRDRIVAVKSANTWGTSFHPELTEDCTMHQIFADL